MADFIPPAMQADAARGADAAPAQTGLPFSSEGAEAPRHPALSRQSYAAIDLGTNNCRLLIARPSGENFAVIDAFSRVVRLGEGLAQT